MEESSHRLSGDLNVKSLGLRPGSTGGQWPLSSYSSYKYLLCAYCVHGTMLSAGVHCRQKRVKPFLGLSSDEEDRWEVNMYKISKHQEGKSREADGWPAVDTWSHRAS
jgi:hypothetical protein